MSDDLETMTETDAKKLRQSTYYSRGSSSAASETRIFLTKINNVTCDCEIDPSYDIDFLTLAWIANYSVICEYD